MGSSLWSSKRSSHRKRVLQSRNKWRQAAHRALAESLEQRLLLAAADIVQSGFNDVTGINGDGLANQLPYSTANAALDGQGAGETGWAGLWHAGNTGIKVG